jgi:magnesium-protoporphyrin IX monomethyl ester (oxidative) cyclase
MRHLKEAFGAKEIFFEDDNLTLDRARADKIFKGMISDRLNLIWSSPNGVAVSTIDHGLLGVIKKSGCRALSFGIESGDNYVLNNIINKPVDVSHAQDIIQEASRLGIETSVFFVVGFPDENRAQLANTIGLAERLRADSVNFFFATPLPGTEFFRRCMEKGLISPGADYRYLHSGKPHFDMVDVARGDLEKLIIKERIRISEMLLKRKPLLFVRKVFKKIVHDPMYFVRFFKKALVKSGGKGVG